MKNWHNAQTLDELQAYLPQLMADIDKAITQAALPEPLQGACRYAMSNGGKRVRPLLVIAALLTASQTPTELQLSMARRAAVAVEMIHGYSLIHDDLPCMDDDALRRGQPTCHIVYGEATALLAGDALQSIAFEAIAGEWLAQQDTAVAFGLLQILAPRARRMVSGQTLDIEGEQQALCQDELQAVHKDKTGALIEAAVLMGGLAAGANNAQMAQLAQYAQKIGLAFQVQDDVLDVIADTQTLGKPAGSDEKLEKSTYVQLLGVAGASEYAATLFDEARASVRAFGANNLLLQLVDWLQKRTF